MKKFMDKNFLLNNKISQKLYHDYAKDMPIFDYHCHVSPKEIFEDKHFNNITEVWLYGDHYKWRLMRSNGVDEKFITGDASDKEKFFKFAESLPKAIGNPMYHWCHLELKKYFGYEGVLNGDTASVVWDLTLKKLQAPDMGVRGIIAKSKVAFIGTTDDPVDSLDWHKKIKEDDSIKTIVAPSFRPDKALNIDKAGWADYIKSLEDVYGEKIEGYSSLKDALLKRADYFDKVGCKASDHGLDYAFYQEISFEEADKIVKKGLNSDPVTACEAEGLKTLLLEELAKKYCQLGWVMQIHYNCIRNPNSLLFNTLGPDTGFDIIGPNNGSRVLTKLIDRFYKNGNLPRTVLYSLDANDNAFLDSLIGAFQGTEIAGKMQHGSAWWFNDHKKGMTDQIVSLANLSILGNFIGMLTDSRSFLSYTRHEYFRRILCSIIGDWVENGEYPGYLPAIGKIVKDISFNNAVKYFSMENQFNL